MTTLRSRIARTLAGRTAGLTLFALVALASALGIGASTKILPMHPPLAIQPDSVTLSATLSQTKIIQNETGTVYLDVTIDVPTAEPARVENAPTDIVVVLDRSGSMAAANKLPYAKAALHAIVSRLGRNDRFALVSFANQAIVHAPLIEIDPSGHTHVEAMIESITAAGGTNLGDGLTRAIQLVDRSATGRSRTIVVLSDGEANQGITDAAKLAAMAKRAADHEIVLSTIGLGLGFNETLMASLADHGMGHYGYLEHPAGLDRVLAAHLDNGRALFAAVSHLQVRLGNGVRLLDAGGYPVDRSSPATASIATGNLIAGVRKRFIMTFEVPTHTMNDVALGEFELLYERGGDSHRVAMTGQPPLVTVLSPDRREEVPNSIDAVTNRTSWLKNNLGRLQARLGQWLREGKKDEAERALADYRDAVEKAEAATPTPLVTPELETTLQAMQRSVTDAFSGSREDQAIKRNRAAKSFQYRARQQQRPIDPTPGFSTHTSDHGVIK